MAKSNKKDLQNFIRKHKLPQTLGEALTTDFESGVYRLETLTALLEKVPVRTLGALVFTPYAEAAAAARDRKLAAELVGWGAFELNAYGDNMIDRVRLRLELLGLLLPKKKPAAKAEWPLPPLKTLEMLGDALDDAAFFLLREEGGDKPKVRCAKKRLKASYERSVKVLFELSRRADQALNVRSAAICIAIGLEENNGVLMPEIADAIEDLIHHAADALNKGATREAVIRGIGEDAFYDIRSYLSSIETPMHRKRAEFFVSSGPEDSVSEQERRQRAEATLGKIRALGQYAQDCGLCSKESLKQIIDDLCFFDAQNLSTLPWDRTALESGAPLLDAVLSDEPPFGCAEDWAALDAEAAASLGQEFEETHSLVFAPFATRESLLRLRYIRMKHGIEALAAIAASVAQKEPETISAFEINVFLVSLCALAAETVDGELFKAANAFLDYAEPRLAGTVYEMRLHYWRARLRSIFIGIDEETRDEMFAFAHVLPNEPREVRRFVHTELRSTKRCLDRRFASDDAIRMQTALLHALENHEKPYGALSSKGDAALAAARTALHVLRGYSSADRGAYWWAAALRASFILSGQSETHAVAAFAAARRLRAFMMHESLTFDEDLASASFLGSPIHYMPEVRENLRNLSIDHYTDAFDLPWFQAVEERIGRIVRRVCASNQLDLIVVENANEPELLHFISTSMSSHYFADTLSVDHEFFVTLRKADVRQFAETTPASARRRRRGKSPAARAAALNITKLELGVLGMLEAVATTYHTSIDAGFSPYALYTRENQSQESEASDTLIDSPLPDYLARKNLTTICDALPYKGMIACDDPHCRRFPPIEYAEGRQLVLSELIALHPEELQFVSDFDLATLFEKTGAETFTPLLEKRPNAMKDFFKGELIPREKLRMLLPEGVENDSCFVHVDILRKGLPIKGFEHIGSIDANEGIWLFHTFESIEPEMLNPLLWRRATLNTVCNYDPDVRWFLSSPVGSAYLRNADGVFEHNIVNEEAMRVAGRLEKNAPLDDDDDASSADLSLRMLARLAEETGANGSGRRDN